MNHQLLTTNYKQGFTLIELILVVGLLFVFGTIAAVTLNPVTQLNRASDAKRENDLSSLKSPLEEYFNDVKCYPQALPFGSALTRNGKTCVTQLPQDSNCSTKGTCYAYQTDGSSCPQWYVIYGKLANTSSASCALTSQSSCLPQNYVSSGYNFCVASEDYVCSYLSQNNIPIGTPTPTPPCSNPGYACAPGGCNWVGAGSGTYCGYAGCSGNQCCSNMCH